MEAIYTGEYLSTIPEGQFVLYVDGRTGFEGGEIAWLEKFFKQNYNRYDLIAWQLTHIEAAYTKSDLLDYFKVLDNSSFTRSPQFAAGLHVWKNCLFSKSLVNEWYEIFLTQFDLVTDLKSEIPNSIDFIDHRHDQSIFSLLVKHQLKSGRIYVIYDNDVYSSHLVPQANGHPFLKGGLKTVVLKIVKKVLNNKLYRR